MQIQQQPDKHSCLVTAFAMVMNMPVADLITRIGIDYKKKIFDDEKQERGINVQDVIREMYLQFSITEIMDISVFDLSMKLAKPLSVVILEAMICYNGVLGLVPIDKQYGHTVAWHYRQGCFDPSSGSIISVVDTIHSLNNTWTLQIGKIKYEPNVFWIVR